MRSLGLQEATLIITKVPELGFLTAVTSKRRGLGGYGVVDAGVFFGLGGYGVVVDLSSKRRGLRFVVDAGVFFFFSQQPPPETTRRDPRLQNFFFLFSAAPPETTSHHQERPTDLFSDLDPPRPATTKERPTAWLSSQICNHRGHAVKHGPPRREARTTTPRSTNHLAVPIPTVWRWWSLPISTVVFVLTSDDAHRLSHNVNGSRKVILWRQLVGNSLD
uniref:Uncharacterized protein n=1 Tax=Fagus sylvatica TaxID=28930 RepID=A0A2N9GY76_FAGSY